MLLHQYDIGNVFSVKFVQVVVICIAVTHVVTKDKAWLLRGAFDSAKNHKRQRHKRQSVTAKREKLQTPKLV